MIDTSQIVDIIRSLGLLSDDELGKISSFCTVSCEQIGQRIKAPEYSNHPAILMACASVALYMFLLVNSTAEDFSSFKAGDITVKHNREARIENAATLKNESLVCAAPYLNDIDFSFKAVEV